MQRLITRVIELTTIVSLCCVTRPGDAATTIIGDADNLVAAVAAAANGDTIEIQSNRTFVGTLSWKDKFLTIQAGDGFHPTVKGSPYNATNPVGFPALSEIVGALGTGGAFSGLRFEPGQHADVLPPPYSSIGPNDFNVVSVGSTGTKWSDLTFQQNDFAGSVRLGSTGSVTFDTAFHENHFLSSLYLGATGAVQMDAVVDKNKIDETLTVELGYSNRFDVVINENDLQGVSLWSSVDSRLSATVTNNFIHPPSAPTSGFGALTIHTNGDAVGQIYAANNVIAGTPGTAGTGIIAQQNLSPSYSGRFVNNTVVGFAHGILDNSYVQSSYENMLLWNSDDIFTFFGSTIDASTIVGSLISDGTFAGSNGNFGGFPKISPTYELLAGSIGIDAGNNLAANLPTLDIVGNARIIDGNGDGIARVDVGAFEYVPEPTGLWSVLLAIGAIVAPAWRRSRG